MFKHPHRQEASMLRPLTIDISGGLSGLSLALRRCGSRFLVVAFAVVFLLTAIKAQNDAPVIDLKSNNMLLDCDDGFARQDIVVTDALRLLSNDAVLFVV